jgi:hypothetical protein
MRQTQGLNLGLDTSCPDFGFIVALFRSTRHIPGEYFFQAMSICFRTLSDVLFTRRWVAQSVERLATGWPVRDSRPARGKSVHSGCGSTQPPIQLSPGGSNEGKATGTEVYHCRVQELAELCIFFRYMPSCREHGQLYILPSSFTNHDARDHGLHECQHHKVTIVKVSNMKSKIDHRMAVSLIFSEILLLTSPLLV